MLLSKIKIGKYVNYTSRTRTGRGKVVAINPGQKGEYVEILDKELGRTIQVRPSQVS